MKSCRPLVVAVLVGALGARAGAQCEVAELVDREVGADTSFGVDVALHDGVAIVGRNNDHFDEWPSWAFELQPGGWTAGSPLPPDQILAC